MPRAAFAGIEFDLLVQGLEDRHEGMTTVREVPGGAGNAYVDLGGPLLHRRTVTIKLDNEAQYLQLAALPGTAGAAGPLTTDEGEAEVVLLALSRYYRRGGPLPQLCRTEWLFLTETGPPPEPPEPPTLDGTAWTATAISDGAGGESAVLAGTTLTAAFDAGALTGSGGCNDYTAAYTVDPDPPEPAGALTVDPPDAGTDVCADPPGVDEQEAAYLAALPTAATYAIADGVLTVLDGDGLLVARYSAPAPARGRPVEVVAP